MFQLVQQAGRDTCRRCGHTIERPDDLSIDHTRDWMHSDTPSELFFDLNNISFSHKSCNYGAARRGVSRAKSESYERANVSATGFKGVYYHPSKKKPFQARAYINGKQKSLGYFSSPEEAARAYDSAMLEWAGDRAMTNQRLGLL